MADVFDVAIAGCGITAMTLARRYTDEGYSVVILDDYVVPGGNHISYEFDGLEFDVGAIIFHTPDPQFKVFPELLDRVTRHHMVHRKVSVGGGITRFPFDLWRDLPGLKLGIVPLSIGEAWARRLLLDSGRDVDAWILSRIGSLLYAQSGLENYIERLSGCKPTELDIDFAESRLGWIARRSRISTQFRRFFGRDQSNSMWRKIAVRAPGGFGAYYTPVVERLRGDGVEVILDAGLTSFVKRADGIRTVSGRFGDVSAHRLISTLPYARSAQLADVAVQEVEHVTLHSLFVEADAPLKANGSIVYNFDRRGVWKRLTVHSNFYNAESGRTGFTVEVPLPPSATDLSADDQIASFREHAEACGLTGSTIKLLGSSKLDFAYFIPRKGYRIHKQAIQSRLEAAGIEGAGRHGALTYLPSSSTAVRAAQRFVDRKV